MASRAFQLCLCRASLISCPQVWVVPLSNLWQQSHTRGMASLPCSIVVVTQKRRRQATTKQHRRPTVLFCPTA
jgi:hypothetical protein